MSKFTFIYTNIQIKTLSKFDYIRLTFCVFCIFYTSNKGY